MSKVEDEREAYLRAYPKLRVWINECVTCHFVGYRPDLPEVLTRAGGVQLSRPGTFAAISDCSPSMRRVDVKCAPGTLMTRDLCLALLGRLSCDVGIHSCRG